MSETSSQPQGIFLASFYLTSFLLSHSMRVWHAATIVPEFQLFPCHPSGMGARTTQIPDFGKILYRHVHAQHHKSYLPTAFSGTNMHPVEVTSSDVQNGFLVWHQNPKIFPTGRPYGKLPFLMHFEDHPEAWEKHVHKLEGARLCSQQSINFSSWPKISANTWCVCLGFSYEIMVLFSMPRWCRNSEWLMWLQATLYYLMPSLFTVPWISMIPNAMGSETG